MALLVCVACRSNTPAPDREVEVALQCQPQVSGTSASLRGLSVVGPEVAWVSGGSGFVARTTDGGGAWINSSPPDSDALDFRDIQGFDENTACVMAAGKSGRILTTIDGGHGWREAYRNDQPGIFLDSMAFWDRRAGIAFSDPVGGFFLVIRTWDGGDSWEPASWQDLPPPEAGEAGFAASGTSIAVGKDGLAWFGTGGGAARVFRSLDGGSSWTVADTPLQYGNSSQGIFSLAFGDAKHGVAVGGDFQYPENSAANTAVTSDGGVTWKAVDVASPRGYRSCVVWTEVESRSVLIAVGPSGSDYSTDNGATWSPLGAQGYHVAAFTGAAGWMAGADGRIARCEVKLR